MTTAAAERIVVVGNGVAGLTACDSLRASGFDGELTIVGDEQHPPYSRPALSKALLRNDADTMAHRLPEPTHQANEILGVSASGLNVERQILHLDDGTDLPYDRLVIATGSRARRLGGSATGADSGELTLRRLEDAHRLRRLLLERPSVVVVGGGPLGMEIASACVAAGCDVTLISDTEPLRPHLGAHLSALFLNAAVEHGVRVITTGSARVTDHAGACAVVTPDGDVFEPDLVVTAAGDIPNVEWLADSGLLTGKQLQVDSRGRLRPDIVAVGDVAAFPTGRGVRRVPLWSSAVEQAKVAASALLFGDGAPELHYQPYFWTEQFGLSLKACGELPAHGDPVVERSEPGGSMLLRWMHEDGSGTAAAINHRIAIPMLRRLASQPPAAVPAASS